MTYVCFYSVECFERKRPRKELISVCMLCVQEARPLNFGNIHQLYTIFWSTSICLRCLKIHRVTVWIYKCLCLDYLRIWITKTVLKNSLKIGFIAVDLAVTKLVKNYDISTN